VVDTGTTMLVTKLGKRLPDDLAEAKESKVSTKPMPAEVGKMTTFEL
jgi:hypothetical protein